MDRLRLALLVSALAPGALAGCTPQAGIGGPCAVFSGSEEPCRQQIYFPAGVAIDPDGDVLYVSSANADLRYSGGAVQSIDLQRWECAHAWARDGVLAPGCDALSYVLPDADGQPIVDEKGVPERVHLGDPDPRDNSRTLIQSDAAGCQRNLLDPQVIECDETPFITSAVKVGNFAGSLRVQTRRAGCYTHLADQQGDGGIVQQSVVEQSAFNRRLWLPVRGDPSITFIDVVKPWDPDLSTNPRDPVASAAHLDCSDPGNGDPAHTLDSCNNQRISTRDFHASGTIVPPAPVVLPPEPFGMWLDEGPRATVDPCDGQSLDPSYSRLVVTHLLGGEITLINSGAFHPASTDTINPTERVVLDVRASLLPADPTGRRGGFAVAPITPGDPLSFWYATSRLTPQIELFRVAEANLVLPAIAFSLGGGAFQAGDDVRDVVPQPELNRVFMVDNHPPSVFTVDTRLVQSNEFQSGAPANQVTDIIPICQGPSHLGLRTFEEPGAPGEPPRTVTRIYVVCFTSGQVAVIDPDLSEVLDQISVGNGANDIAFNFGPGMAEPAHRRAYVATYSDSAIAVIDLDRGSPTEDRVVGRIGVIYRPGQ